jgi:diguanylate cyclase (GGDEF)-like protein/PAS domain S-box-containing protein
MGKYVPPPPASTRQARNGPARSSAVDLTLDVFRDLFETAPYAKVVIDGSGNIVLVNAQTERLFGWQRSELIGQKVELLLPERFRAPHSDHRSRYSNAPMPRNMGIGLELLGRRKDGAEFSVEISLSPLQTPTGLLVSAAIRDISDRIRTEAALEKEREFLKALLESLNEGISACDAQGTLTLFNSAAREIVGLPEQPLPPEKLAEYYSVYLADGKTPAPLEQIPLFRALQGETVHDVELVLAPKGKSRRTILVNGRPIVTPSGKKLGAVNAFHDITESKKQQDSILRLSRVYAVLSGINTLIVRCRNRDELFREACRIAIEKGGFRLAWIGLLDPELSLKPVAFHGLDDGYIVQLGISLKPGDLSGQGPAGMALRERQPYISNDIASDPAMARTRALALERGFRSLVCFPLLVRGEVVGSFCLYAGEAGYFDEEEMKLLSELAGNISYAMEFILHQEEASYLAYYDPLTGLANLRLFQERTNQHIQTARNDNKQVAVALVDIDRFKSINDSLGRSLGDELLKEIASRLSRFAGNPNYLARVSGDRFVAVIPGLTETTDLARVVQDSVVQRLSRPFTIAGQEVRVSGKAGVALFPADGQDAESLISNTESALKSAKHNGESVVFYTRQISEIMKKNATLENRLRQAIERKEFILHYQPKVDLGSGSVHGVEALIRWQSPDLGLVPPLQFIPLLEETRLIEAVGLWAIEQALEDRRQWQLAGLSAPRVAVNVSSQQLNQPGFLDQLRDRVTRVEGRNHGLDIEVTESMLMTDIESSLKMLVSFRDMGIEIAIDDFGTGYSSLSYLGHMPITTIKIDRSFIVKMTDNANNASIVSTIITLAHSMGLKVVAEGVDSAEQLKFLRLLRCDQIQGYLFSKPLPADGLAELLRQDRRL